MAFRKDLPNGKLYEKDDVLIYEMPLAGTNLVEAEQLDELKREDPLFFLCKHYIVNQETIRIFYNREKGFRSLADFRQSTDALKRRLAEGILATERMVGTQYTTLLHPDNIFADRSGRVKFAYRGLRSVSPEEELNAGQVLEGQKKVLLYLFTDYAYSDSPLMAGALQNGNHPFAAGVMSAKTTEQLRQVISGIKEESGPPPVKTSKEPEPKAAHTSAGNGRSTRMTLLSGLLIGLLVGMAGIYMLQVLPLNKELQEAAAAEEKETNEHIQQLTEQNKELETSLEENRNMLDAYQSVVTGDTEAAIAAFEASAELDVNAEQTLIEQYLKLETVDGFMKAAEMDEEASYHERIATGLVALGNEQAEDALLSIESPHPAMQIEQAWLREEHEEVVSLSGQLEDSGRAKLLAARSHIQLENADEALKLAEDLENKEVQIAALEKKKQLIEADEDMDEDETKEEIEKLDERIEDLKD